MNLLEGLEKFGLDKMDTEHIFEEEKKEEETAQPKPEVQEVVHSEKEFLLEKSIRCPVCDFVFKTKMVKTGRASSLILICVRDFSTLIRISMMYLPAQSVAIRR